MQQQNEEVLIEANEKNLIKGKVENQLILIKNQIEQLDTELNVINDQQHTELKAFMEKYMVDYEKTLNKKVGIKQIISRGGKDSFYQYREVLYVIVTIQDNNLHNLEAKAFEVDQIYDTKSNKLWKVNRELTLDKIAHNLKLEYDEFKKADEYFKKFNSIYRENFKIDDLNAREKEAAKRQNQIQEQQFDSYFN